MPHIGDLASHTLAVLLAGGNGTRLAPLTRHICKPALPFGGAFRSIDFTLSNCVNSGLRGVGVATQYKPAALLEHLAEAWRDTATTIVPWHAADVAPATGYRGTADAVYRNLERIGAFGPRLVLVLAGDHVYKMDYRPMLEQHCARRADVTVGCIQIPVEDARHFGVLTAAPDGRIERFVEKPRSKAELPATTGPFVLASMGIYVFDVDFLERVLKLDAVAAGSRHDFGADILPKLVAHARAFAHAFRGTEGSRPPYWRDIGTLRAYWQAHMDLLEPAPPLSLDDCSWPIAGGASPPRSISAPLSTARGGTIESSIVGPRYSIAGRVRHSVLFEGVEVGRGASVVDSVILPGARIGTGSRLRGVIVDADCRVPEGAVLERNDSDDEPLMFAGDMSRDGTYALNA